MARAREGGGGGRRRRRAFSRVYVSLRTHGGYHFGGGGGYPAIGYPREKFERGGMHL